MSTQSVLAIYDNREKAKLAIAALLKGGVTEQCISVVSREEQLPDSPEEQEDFSKDVSIGAAVGTTVGALTGGVAMLATGVGTIAIAGALVATLGGAASGSLIGLLAGYSINEKQAHGYEKLIKSGHVLVFVHGDPLQVAQAQSIFAATPPHILHLHGEAPDGTT